MAKGADEIWHLGDVCAETILDELRAIGPRVTVVRGNCDSNFEWPLVLDLVRGGLKFRLQHVPPDRPPDDVDVLLHGHTHVPRNERRGRVLFLNPGCVTRPNRGAPQVWPGLKSRTEKSIGISCRFADARYPWSRDSLLIKSAAIAFLHEDEFGSRSNLRVRKAMAAFLVCRRAELVIQITSSLINIVALLAVFLTLFALISVLERKF
jgi:putative phosphoesterase